MAWQTIWHDTDKLIERDDVTEEERTTWFNPNATGSILAGIVARAEAEESATDPVQWAPVTHAGNAVPPGRKVVWTDGHTYRNDSGGWLSHSPEEYPRGWTCLDCEPAGEWAPWVQPQPGVTDSYAKDAKVTHKDQRWTSNLDGNVWEPGVYGWTLAP